MANHLKNSALLLIEFQHEWLNEKGKLHALMTDKTVFLESVERAKQVVAVARQVKMPIIHSGLSFQAHYPELGMAKYGLRSTIPAHKTFLASAQGSRFYEPFIPQPGEFVVTGRVGSSAFAGSNLDNYLRHQYIHTLYLMGYALHICVESTIRAAHDLGYETILIEDASAAFTQEQKNYVLTDVIPHFGTAIKSDMFITLLTGASKVSKAA